MAALLAPLEMVHQHVDALVREHLEVVGVVVVPVAVAVVHDLGAVHRGSGVSQKGCCSGALGWLMFTARSRVLRPHFVLVLALVLASQAHAQKIQSDNLVVVEEFCLFVSIQTSVTDVENRSDELRDHLLRQATLYRAPVDDCQISFSVTKPSINIIVMALDRAFTITAMVMVDMPIRVEGQMMDEVVIWNTSYLAAGGSVTFDRVRDESQRLFENLILEWRRVTGN